MVEFRGSVETRLRKLGEGVAAATFLAMAGLKRLGLDAVPRVPIDPEEMLPAVAQGAIGIEQRSDDARVAALLAPIHDAATGVRMAAERAFLAGLDGSCQTPIAGLAELDGGRLRFRGEILLPDGSECLRHEAEGDAADAVEIGAAAAASLRGRAGPGFFAGLRSEAEGAAEDRQGGGGEETDGDAEREAQEAAADARGGEAQEPADRAVVGQGHRVHFGATLRWRRAAVNRRGCARFRADTERGDGMAGLSQRALAADAEWAVIGEFFAKVRAIEGAGDACDFTFGNPHEMPLPGLVAALRGAIEPRREDWFAYVSSEPEARATIATALSGEIGMAVAPEDVTLTQGAFGAIALAFRLVMDAGAEVILPVPGWFCLPPMLRAADLVPVKVPLDPARFDLDLAAIDAAITPRTRMVVVNSPHNPTGRIYPRQQLEALAAVLEAASRRIGARIWLLSDEPYRRIRFDGNDFTSPAVVYPWTMIDYSYGKVLLAPGARLGYLALSPLMPEPERTALQGAFQSVQMGLGWTFPDAVMQYAVPALEAVSIDIAALAARRDRLLGALEGWGYRMTRPEGTFYLWGAAPGGDAVRFADRLAATGVYVMPGTLFERPGDFRISLTANDEMVTRALPRFEAAAREG